MRDGHLRSCSGLQVGKFPQLNRRSFRLWSLLWRSRRCWVSRLFIHGIPPATICAHEHAECVSLTQRREVITSLGICPGVRVSEVVQHSTVCDPGNDRANRPWHSRASESTSADTEYEKHHQRVECDDNQGDRERGPGWHHAPGTANHGGVRSRDWLVQAFKVKVAPNREVCAIYPLVNRLGQIS